MVYLRAKIGLQTVRIFQSSVSAIELIPIWILVIPDNAKMLLVWHSATSQLSDNR